MLARRRANPIPRGSLNDGLCDYNKLCNGLALDPVGKVFLTNSLVCHVPRGPLSCIILD